MAYNRAIMPVRFSVVIPALNEEKFLPHLLASLAAQTVKNFEVVVVDGSSRDKTVAIARSFAKKLPKLQVIVSKTASLPLQRNLGAQKTSGEWLIFIDADSVLYPHFFQRAIEYIEQKNPSFFSTWVSPDSQKPGDANMALFYSMVLEMSLILKKPFAPGPLTAVLRRIYDRVGGYSEEHAYNEDVDFSMRVQKENVALHIIPETLYIWSLRRLRDQGSLKVAQQYLLSSFPILLFNRPFKYMPGYSMGGHLYDAKKKLIASSKLKQYEKKFKALVKELFI